MSEQAIELKVYRYDGTQAGSATYQSFFLPPERTSVLMALRYIRDNLDPTLEFRDYHCAKGACTSCLVRLDGKVVKGCEAMLEPDGSYVLDPAGNNGLIRDLTVFNNSEKASSKAEV